MNNVLYTVSQCAQLYICNKEEEIILSTQVLVKYIVGEPSICRSSGRSLDITSRASVDVVLDALVINIASFR